MVLKMPRSIGIRCGVKITDTGLPATSESACSISGVCRWLPTEYAATLSLHSGKCVVSFGVRPAPHAPRLELVGVERLAAQVEPAGQARVQVGDVLVLPGRDRGDLDPRVPEQDLQQLDRRVPRPTQHADLD